MIKGYRPYNPNQIYLFPPSPKAALEAEAKMAQKEDQEKKDDDKQDPPTTPPRAGVKYHKKTGEPKGQSTA